MKNKSQFISRFAHEVIDSISDYNYQLRSWARGEGVEVDSYDETMNEFAYFFEIIEKDPASFGLSEDEFEKIKTLEKRIDEHGDLATRGYDEEIISHPSWEKVIEAAKDVKQALARFEEKEC